MEKAIVILLILELVWSILRDIDARKYRFNLDELKRAYDMDRKILQGNWETAKEEVAYFRKLVVNKKE